MNIIYVKPSGTAGDGTFQNPFSDLTLALESYTKDTEIVLLDGEYSFTGGSIDLHGHDGVIVRSHSTGGASIHNLLTMDIKDASVSFIDVGFAFNAQSEILVNQSLLQLISCDFYNLPAVTNRVIYVSSGTVNISDSVVNGDTLPAGCPGEFIYCVNQGRVQIENSTIINLPEQYLFMHIRNDSSSVLVSGNQFVNVKGCCVVYDAYYPSTDVKAMSFLVKGNTFRSVTRAIMIDSEDGTPVACEFRTNIDGTVLSSAGINRNYFIDTYVVLETSIIGQVTYINNTAYMCHFGIVATKTEVQIQNSIFSNFVQTVTEDQSLWMAFPYNYSIVNLRTEAICYIAYSCLYANAYGEVGTLSQAGIVKGPIIRFTDPLFTSPDTGDFSLATNSPLIDSGIGVVNDYSGATSDIGAYEFSVSVVSNVYGSYLQRMREHRKKLPMPQTDIRGYIEARLKEEYPSLDTGAGSVINDLLIKPLVAVLTPFQAELEYMKKKTSLAYADQLEEADMDDLASNFFLQRRKSTKSYGYVRVYYYFPVDITIPVRTTFTSSSGYVVSTIREFAFTSWELVLNKDESTGFYYVDVMVESSDVNVNIAPNSIISSDLDNEKGIAKITNPGHITGGTRNETNQELLERIRKSITTRNLVNSSSIETVIMDNFSNVSHCLSVGFGDAEMSRDILPGFSTQHFGGCVDTYIKTNTIQYFSTTAVVPMTNEPSNMFVVLSAANLVGAPILFIKRVVRKDSGTGLEIDQIPGSAYSLRCSDISKRYSPYEELQLVFNDSSYAGATIGIEYYGVPLVKEINDFIRSNSRRVLCSDNIAKVFAPYQVTIEGSYKGRPDSFSKTAIAIEDYIESITPGGTISVNEIYNAVYAAGGMIDMSTLQVHIIPPTVNGDGKSILVSNNMQIPRNSIFVLNTNALRYLGDI